MNGQTIVLSGRHSIAKAKELIDKAPHGAVVNIREARRTTDQNHHLANTVAETTAIVTEKATS